MDFRKYKLLIFDWDGTLIDSEANIVFCIESAILDVGKVPPVAGKIRHIIGLGLQEALEILLPGESAELYTQVADRYRHHFYESAQSEPFPAASETLLALSQQGYLLAVATGKGRRGLDLALKNTNWESFFIASRCADETQSKPHPQMLLELLDQLSLQPSQALMIGDTSYDLNMASNAAIDSVAVCTGVHEQSALLECQPVGCLAAVSDLVEWLKNRDVVHNQP